MRYHFRMQSPAASSSVFVRIADATSTLIELLDRLEAEIAEKRRNPHGGYGSGSGGHPPLAWNAGVAMLLMEIHSGCRELEQDLKYQVSGRIRTRGGSDGNTVKALEGLPGLVAGVDHAGAVLVARRLESWAFRARLVLGDSEPFARFPRLPGQKAPACPFCHTPDSLRYRPFSGQVRCLRPTCRDSQGNRPEGRIDVGDFSGDPLIAWASGEIGVEVGDAQEAV
jgi:hypothetical protein